jgi:hypothetical protein
MRRGVFDGRLQRTERGIHPGHRLEAHDRVSRAEKLGPITHFLTSCGDSEFWDSSCKSERAEIEDLLDSPEEVETYRSSQ